MSTESQIAQADQKNQRKIQPPVTETPDSVVETLPDFQPAITEDSVESQVAMLKRLPPGQSQAMLARMNRLQGNQHVQRVMASLHTGPVVPHSPAVQTQLTVNEPDDEYEQEADQTADTVMRMTAPPPAVDEQDEIANASLAGQDVAQRKKEEERVPPGGNGAGAEPANVEAGSTVATTAPPTTAQVAPPGENGAQATQVTPPSGSHAEATQTPSVGGNGSRSELPAIPGGNGTQAMQPVSPGSNGAGAQPARGETTVATAPPPEAAQTVEPGGGKAQATQVTPPGGNGTEATQAAPLGGNGAGSAPAIDAQAASVPAAGVPTTTTPQIAGDNGTGQKAETKAETDAAAEGEKAPASPEEDPAFQAVLGRSQQVAVGEQAHEPSGSKAAEAQEAADPQGSDVEMAAQDRQVQDMEQQEPGEFSAAEFKAALMERIQNVAPSTLEEADDFKDSNKIDSVKQDVAGRVSEEKEEAGRDIEQETEETPNTGGITPKPVTPVAQADAGPPPPDIGAAGAAPKTKTTGELEAPLQQGSQALDQQMANAEITEEQLANSNEPEFQAALDAKKGAQANAAQAPQAYRQEEAGIIDQAQAGAQSTAMTQQEAMHAERAQLLTGVFGLQGDTKTTDEAKRTEVATEIATIYQDTKTEVEEILKGLDETVVTMFDDGANEAQRQFEDYVDQRMEAYKDERYSGIEGATQWVIDKFLGLPDEVNTFYVEGRQLYINYMDGVLDGIANHVAGELNRAKARIAQGRQAIQQYVTGLPQELQQVGAEAAQDIQSKFDELEQGVNAKQDELVNTLTQKYQENLQQIDARIEEMKAANRGLVDKAKDAIGGVIQTILELKDMLLSVLSNAADAIMMIIQDPIGFLGNLIEGIKQGFLNFVANIGTHLKQGLMTWLFGAMTEAGIQLPKSFDIKGILSLVMQVLGLTWQNIRARAVKLLGEKVVGALETAFEIFTIIRDQGLGGLWEYIKEKVGDLKTMVIEGIKDMVITQVIQSGIQWLMGILGGPLGAFIKAAKAIYDIVMWFVTNGSQLMALVNAVIGSITSIASGAVGQAAQFIEQALAKAIPVVIGFLASLLGIGDLGKKVRGIIEKVKAPINKAIDWVLTKAKDFAKKVGGMLGFGKDKGEEHDPRVQAGLSAIDEEEKRYTSDSEGRISQEEAEKVAQTVKTAHPVFKSIAVIDGGNTWDYQYVASPAKTKKGEPKSGTMPIEDAHQEAIQEVSQSRSRYLLIGRGRYIGGHRGHKFTARIYQRITEIGKQDGCHTCGSKDPKTASGNFIPDHQAPNSVVENGGMGRVRFYPHCADCSSEQKYIVNSYKAQIKRLLGREEKNWAKDIKSEWFWE